jgi:hypothetical protein
MQSCWAEMTGSNGFGENWVRQWSEEYGLNGFGRKVPPVPGGFVQASGFRV